MFQILSHLPLRNLQTAREIAQEAGDMVSFNLLDALICRGLGLAWQGTAIEGALVFREKEAPPRHRPVDIRV